MFDIPKPKDFDELVILHDQFAHLLEEQRCAAVSGETHDSGMLDSIEEVLLGGCGMFREFAREQISRISDNAKSVNELREGKGRVVNARFYAMCSHYLFDPEFCNVASGWEKGIVEKNVQDSRRRIWQEAGTLRFGSFAELNDWLLARCKSLWHEVRHPECRELTVADMLEHEQSHLMPMVNAAEEGGVTAA